MSGPAQRVLGIDPGLNITGYAVIERAGGKLQLIEAGVVRGGPLLRLPGERRLYAELWSDPRRSLTAGSGLYLRGSGPAGSEVFGFAQIGYRPSPQWSIALRPELTRLASSTHYVARVQDPGAAATFGHRYLFAELRQTTAALETRLEYTFSPNLSLQLFARPFVSAGRVSGYKELLAPRTLTWGVYGEGHGTLTQLGSSRWALDADAWLGRCSRRA